MTAEQERNALIALGDQIQEICVNSGVDVQAFIVFGLETVEYRSPHTDRSLIVTSLRGAADELEKDL